MQNVLKNRREFFKEAAKKTLPVLGMAIMATIAPSTLSSCSKEHIGCGNSCSGSCKTDCSGECGSSCNKACSICSQSCSNGCKGTCKQWCDGGNRL